MTASVHKQSLSQYVIGVHMCGVVCYYTCTLSTQIYPTVVTVHCMYVQDNATALYWASDGGHDEVVRVLLAAKATVNIQNEVSSMRRLVNYFNYSSHNITLHIHSVGTVSSVDSKCSWLLKMC